MRSRFLPTPCIPCLALLLGLAAVTALPAHAGWFGTDAVTTGNKAYAAGDYQGALNAYDQASVDAPESALLYFNRGAALYMQEDYEQAKTLFEQAALRSTDLSLEARSQFNLGNTLFRQSQRQQDSDLRQSMAAMEEAVDHYQRALELDPNLTDAAHNIEISRLTLKQLLDQLQQQQEQVAQQQQQQQQQQKSLQELLDQQSQLAQKTAAQAAQEADGQQGDIDGLAKQQKHLQQQTEALAQQMKTQNSQPGKEEADKTAEQLQQAAAHQQQASTELDEQRPAAAQAPQQQAIDNLQQALDTTQQQDPTKGDQQEQAAQDDKQDDNKAGQASTTQPDKEQQPPSDNGQPGDTQPGATGSDNQNAPQAQQARAVRNETAHDILDQEQENREQRQLTMPADSRPVDKDW